VVCTEVASFISVVDAMAGGSTGWLFSPLVSSSKNGQWQYGPSQRRWNGHRPDFPCPLASGHNGKVLQNTEQ
jgi:hypothetical protein